MAMMTKGELVDLHDEFVNYVGQYDFGYDNIPDNYRYLVILTAEGYEVCTNSFATLEEATDDIADTIGNHGHEGWDPRWLVDLQEKKLLQFKTRTTCVVDIVD
jgi:hypothetical protein